MIRLWVINMIYLRYPFLKADRKFIYYIFIISNKSRYKKQQHFTIHLPSEIIMKISFS